MAQKKVEAKIRVGAESDGSLKSVGTRLENFAKKADKLSRGLSQLGTATTGTITAGAVTLGKSSLSLYSDFEDNMLTVKALGGLAQTQYDAVTEAARNAGATTRYTASQAAEAMVYAAQSGLTYTENIELLGNTLNMATAGSMDLATASEQLNTAMAVLGFGVEDADTYVDQLAITSARSKANMLSLGEAMQRLGGMARFFAGGQEEVLALLGVAGNYGAYGTEAGTYLRNTLLALAAPTNKAAKLMAELGISTDEYEEALEGLDIKQSSDTLKQYGVSAFTVDGELRPLMDTMTDLNAVTAGMTDKQKMDILNKIFPKRTVTFAMNMLKAVGEEYDDLYQQVQNSEGFAQSVADIKESGLGGALRELASAWEEFQLAWADPMSEVAIDVLSRLRDGLLALSDMNDTDKEAILGFIAKLAAAGPAMLGAAALFKVGAFVARHPLLTITGLVGGAVLALDSFNDWRIDSAIAEQFGDLGIDAANFQKSIQTAYEQTNGVYLKSMQELNGYDQRLQELADSFESSKNNLSSGIFDAYLMGYELTREDKTKLQNLAGEMVGTLTEALDQRENKDSLAVNVLLGDLDTADQKAIKESLNRGTEGLRTELKETGKSLNDALVNAWLDGKISNSEREDINAYIAKLNEINAEIQRIQREQDIYYLKNKAGSVGLDGIKDIRDSASEAFAGYRDDIEKEYSDLSFGIELDKELDPIEKRRRLGLIDQERQDAIDALSADEMDVVSRAMWPGLSDAFGEAPNLDNKAFQKAFKDVMDADTVSDLTEAVRYYLEAGQAVPEELSKLFDMTVAFSDKTGYLAGDVEQMRALVGQEFSDIAREAGLSANEEYDAAQKIDDITLEKLQLAQRYAEYMGGLSGQTFANAFNAELIASLNIPLEPTGEGPKNDKNSPSMQKYAQGGFSDRPAIFGEDGEEAAIPIRNTPRTRSLLLETMDRAGISPVELFGAKSGPTVQYSPTVIVNGNGNKKDIEDLLKKERASLKRMIEEMMRGDDDARLAF